MARQGRGGDLGKDSRGTKPLFLVGGNEVVVGRVLEKGQG